MMVVRLTTVLRYLDFELGWEPDLFNIAAHIPAPQRPSTPKPSLEQALFSSVGGNTTSSAWLHACGARFSVNNGTDNTGIDHTPRLSTLAELDFLDPVGMSWSGREPNSSSTYHGSADRRQHKQWYQPNRYEADDHPWLFHVGGVSHLWASSSGNVYVEL